MRMPNAVAGLLIAALAVSPGHGEEDFEARWKDAERNRETSAGQHYEDAFGGAFSPVYAPWLNECAQKPGASMENFDLLVKIGGKGEVEQARVKPATQLAECFMALAKGKTWPAPPSPGYWWLAAVRFSEPKP